VWVATVNEFEELEVWKKARVLQKEVFKLTKTRDFSKDYRLVTQINDATDSTMGNISEGIERDGRKELMQFLSFAKGSAGEVRSHLWVAYDRGYIDEVVFNSMHGICKDVSKMLGGFLRYLKSSQVKGNKYKETA
jgi:four helix bundle protein